jgi:hypothetical protein
MYYIFFCKHILMPNTRSGRGRMVAVLQHLLDTKLPLVVLLLGKTKLYQAVMIALSKCGVLEAERR